MEINTAENKQLLAIMNNPDTPYAVFWEARKNLIANVEAFNNNNNAMGAECVFGYDPDIHAFVLFVSMGPVNGLMYCERIL